MSQSPPPSRAEGQRYDLYDRLDRLEELLEDMDELGVTTVAEAEAEIAELNRRIDELEAGGSS